ncbi:unnamed protein product [Arabis nemorensis]|uniref:Uncharacterized protein n=1 Tax=Arabis nemorensis TaxID=586526 RepID=A0A565ATL2_9BRAS|nr:unnamed protein product [Arabis nemorensis]
MASFVSENVAAEKMDAMNKFERTRKFWKILQVIEVLVAVLLLLSWLTPFLSAGEYLRWVLSGGLTRGIFIFGVVNVLIALIFSLSNRNKLIEPDLYVQYVSSSATTTIDGEDRPMRREMVRAVSYVGETDHVIRRKYDMTFLPTGTSESRASDQVYRRSRSERLDRRGGFRRSIRGLCEIDDLSSDEFRSTVEMFIAGKKKMLLKEWMKP